MQHSTGHLSACPRPIPPENLSTNQNAPNQLWLMHDVPETDRRGFASGSEEARHESERRLSPCRRGDYHAASQCLCGARLDAGRTAGGEISAWAIPSAVGGGGPARRLGRDD